MIYRYAQGFCDKLTEASTPEQAYFALWDEWPNEDELGFVSEVPEDQIMLMSGQPMLPGLDWVKADGMRKLMSKWIMRRSFGEASEAWVLDDLDDMQVWNMTVHCEYPESMIRVYAREY